MPSLKKPKEVLRIEANAIRDLIKRIDRNFNKAIDILFKCRGKVIVTGMGKAGIIAQKISATLSSLATPSIFLHPADAIHGDLGRVVKDDVIIALSNSGQTEEILRLLTTIKKIGAKLISLIGNTKSELAKNSDVVLNVSVKKEACPFGLAPTASTTAMLAMGDALAIALAEKKGIRKEDFALYHPGGSLGKRLILKVEDIMRTGRQNPVVKEDTLIKDVLLVITGSRAGAASVVNSKGRLIGIFTDGDLRRHLETDSNLVSKKVKEVMTKNPTAISKDKLAQEALNILRQKKIDEVPVIDKDKRPIGMLDVQDLLKAGLV
ncbi:MAG TPA: KpsF/GutQ family sugar-phosphate isomerase [Candidatus Omnitrophica bacterium]|nr:KpsF/GutQ family sugar-phosphate isomerase [Candidatus Omnitrophota bacterium]